MQYNRLIVIRLNVLDPYQYSRAYATSQKKGLILQGVKEKPDFHGAAPDYPEMTANGQPLPESSMYRRYAVL